MVTKKVYHIVEWIVAIAACTWLIWKIATYEDYAALGEALRGMGWQQWLAIGVSVALMPVNMALEAWRWHSLMNGVQCTAYGVRLSWPEAMRQVYYSKLAGLITPWRLGEYPARAVIMSEGVNELKNEGLWAKVLSMGAVGSATMTIAIIAAGTIAMIFEIGDLKFENGYYFLIGAVLLLLILALTFAPRLLRRWATVSHRLVAISVGQSLVRLGCWCVQLALVLYVLSAFSFPDTVFSLPIYYLLVTITPNVPVAEAGVRGAWAMVIFGTMNAALAGVLLWVINTLMPCIVWFFLRKKD
jgi:hypothetical protein